MYIIACIISTKNDAYLGNCYHAATFEEAKKFAVKLAKHYCVESEEKILFEIGNSGYFLYEEFEPYASYEVCIRSSINLKVGDKVRFTNESDLTDIGTIIGIDGENFNVKDAKNNLYCVNQHEVEYWNKIVAR